MPLIQSPQGTIEVLEWGAGDTAFVLLHASATGPAALTGLARRLDTGDRRIIAPAFVGYGETDLGAAADDRLAAHRAVVREVVQRLPAGRRVLFGHSMGGLVALETALDAEADGNRFDAVILYEPILIDMLDLNEPDHAEALAWDRAIIARLHRDVGAGDAEAGVSHFIEAWNETRWDTLPEAARRDLVAQAQNLVRETAAVSHHRLERSRLAASTTPTLLLRGACAPRLIAYTNGVAAGVMPRARQRTLPGCGHMGPLLKPADVAGAIEAFVSTV